MNFSSSVLHIVVEPATDCCMYASVVDTIEQLLMVYIVESSCQIERDDFHIINCLAVGNIVFSMSTSCTCAITCDHMGHK